MTQKAIYGAVEPAAIAALQRSVQTAVAEAQGKGEFATVDILRAQYAAIGKEVTVKAYTTKLNEGHPALCPCCSQDNRLPFIVQNKGSTKAPLRFAHHPDSDPACKMRAEEPEHSQAKKVVAEQRRRECLLDPVIVSRTIQFFRSVLGHEGGFNSTGFQDLAKANDKASFWKQTEKQDYPFKLMMQGGPYQVSGIDGALHPFGFRIITQRTPQEKRFNLRPRDVRFYAVDSRGELATFFPGRAFDLLSRKQDEQQKPGLYCGTDKQGKQYIRVTDDVVRALTQFSLDDITKAAKAAGDELTRIQKPALKRSIHACMTSVMSYVASKPLRTRSTARLKATPRQAAAT